MDKFESAVIELKKDKVKALADLDLVKRRISKKLAIVTPSNVDLLKAYHKLVKNKTIKTDKVLEFLLIKRRVRSLSGIVNVSVLTKPYECPGKCLYCPAQEGVPRSYLKKEPAVQRALLNNFDPYLQVETRLKSLTATGHPIDKVELRIIGGTWSYYPKAYQTSFVLQCFNACNGKPARNATPHSVAGGKLRSLEKAQKLNEKAKSRITGMTIETRPDYINDKEIKRLRSLGITRVELGVQSIYNDVLKLNKRDHLIEETIRATKLLKDAGFKVSYQMMPNLPGSTFKKDVEMFKELFSNPDFQPDLLKIYPLALVKEAPIYKLYKNKKYKPYSKEQLIKLLVEIKKHIPYYVRIERIIRDIPADYVVEGGVKVSNLRQVVQKKVQCKCIRCREVKDVDSKEKLHLFRQDYDSSDGKEIFISYENKSRTHLYSLLKLRISKSAEDGPLRAMIREIHTYGQMIPVAGKGKAPQHKGLGKKLMKKAEQITKREFGLDKMSVISGVGVRGYYRKLGYKLRDTYMVKSL